MKKIDLNCDLGEGGAYDHLLMPLISSCNIACGGHFGTPETMEKTIDLASKNKVHIGAHPSYPDKENFGREPLKMDAEDLRETLTQQIKTLKKRTEERGLKLHHVKPHGALYHEVAHDREKALFFIEIVKAIDPDLLLFAPPKSLIIKEAEGKLRTWNEGFADRAYEPDFSLVSRKKNKAVLKEKQAVFKQVFSMVSEGKIHLKNEVDLMANFDTICVHSDTENSVEILRFLNRKLEEKNIQITKL